MTNEDLIRLDQRVVALEGIIISLQQRVSVLEGKVEASDMKVETLNAFYGTALGDVTNRLLTIFDKATSATVPTP